MKTSRKLRRAAYVLGIVILILLVAYGALAWCIYSSSGGFPTKGAEYPAQRISELIWPTVGYPAMVTPGGLIEIEVDLRDVAGEGARAEDVSGWRAVMKPARKELTGLAYTLTPTGARRAASDRWPEGTRFGGPGAVWHVDFRVPAEVMPELYDLHWR